MGRVGPLLLVLCCLGSGLAAASDDRAEAAYATGDYATAFREWSARAEAGDGAAMVAVGTLYDTGAGVPQDFAKALEWYRRAATAGNVRAMFNVGAMYDNGRGVTIDRAAALRWYEMAAARGHGRAAYAAGLIYRDGDGVPPDRAAAIRYFRLAAGAGVDAGRTNLVALGAVTQPAAAAAAPARPTAPVQTVPGRIASGQIAQSQPGPSQPGPGQPGPGQGAPIAVSDLARVEHQALAGGALDPALAAAFSNLFPTLAEQAGKGVNMAQYDVAYAYEWGHGVAPNPVKSYVYYLLAAAAPDAELRSAARRGASVVGNRLTDAQHRAAREMLLDNAR